MEQRHKDYTDYYQTRMKRYENNSTYPFSYETEKAMYEAIASSEKLEDFKDKMMSGNLNVKNGIALAKDQATARKKHYEELKEFLRMKGQEEILNRVEEAQTDIDLANLLAEIEQKNSNEIAIDEFLSDFHYNLKLLEDLEVYKNAEVPDEWKSERQEGIARDEKAVKESIESDEEQAQALKANWKYKFEQLWEERHKRKIPVPDAVLEKRIAEIKAILGR